MCDWLFEAGHTRRTDESNRLCRAQSAGMRKQFGSDMKPLQAGLAAKTAVWSMDLACSGFGGNDSVLDGALGFFHSMEIWNLRKAVY